MSGTANYDLPAPQCNQAGFGSVCAAYRSQSCCSASYVSDFQANPGNLYPGWALDQCPRNKTLSASCRRFLEYQECSYGCDANPRVNLQYLNAYGQDTNNATGAIPLCASYCDEWFDACADDYTCWTDWSNWPQANPANPTYS